MALEDATRMANAIGGTPLARNPLDRSPLHKSRAKRTEEREFRFLLRVGFAFFLVLITLRRLMPWNWLRRSRSGTPWPSIIAEARAAANTTIPYAFN